jgi:adenylate kinase
MRIALLGPPGSGKETQSRKLASHYGLAFLTIADMIRDAAQEGTEAGRQAKPFLDLGQHVPDEVLFTVLRERLNREDVRQGFFLTGFPRTTHQADVLDALLDELGLPLDLVLLLEVDADLIMERLEGLRICISCGQNYNIYSHPSLVDGICDECGGRLRHRADNNEVTLTNRLKIYEHQTVSLIQYYRLHGKLRQIEAEGGVDEVSRALCKVIEEAPPTVVETVPVEEPPVSVEPITVYGIAEPEPPPMVAEVPVPVMEEKAPKQTVAKRSAPKPSAAPKTGAKKAAPKKSAAQKSTVKKSAANTKKAGTKTLSKKSVAQQAAPKKTTAKKAAPKKATAKKSAPGKSGVKRTAAKKTTAKKAAPKKTTVKKAPCKKTTAKKAAPKKSTAKKSAAKKAAPKKSTAKKSAAKKSTAKKKTTRR